MAEQPQTPGGDAHVKDDLPCYQCGYNLHALPTHHVCPECGYRIATSQRLTPTTQWPMNAEKPCRLMGLGLFTTPLLGLGLPLWALGLFLFVHRMPRKNFAWAILQYATSLTAIGTLASILLMMAFAVLHGINVYIPVSMYSNTVLFFTLSTSMHYCLVFPITMRFTSDMKSPVTFRLAAGGLALQVAYLIGLYFISDSLIRFADGLVLIGILWTMTGGVLFYTFATTIRKKRERLKNQTIEANTRPFKTITV